MTHRILCIVFTVMLMTVQTSALPAFARKYDMSCTVCHSPVPKLKLYGDEFAANGYQLKDKEPARFTRETGDDKLLLMRELPLAIRFDGYSRFLPKNITETDIQWAYIMKILSGGQIAKDVSYFLYFLFNERGEVAGVEDAFIYFNNIGDAPIDAMVGQYQVADPIFKRELRPTFEDYVIYTVKPGRTKADLTYDRGILLSYSLETGTDIMASVLNGNGIGAADPSGNFDSDPYKNLFFRLAQRVDSSISIGTLGYIGKERDLGVINDFTMFGGDATLSLAPVELCMQYVYRSDKNPNFLASGATDIVSQGGFVQCMYAPKADKSDWYGFLLYNNVRSDLSALQYQSMTGNFTYIIARNFKVLGEYTYDLEKERHRFTVGFVTAF